MSKNEHVSAHSLNDQNNLSNHLFTSIDIRGLTLKNRIVMSPMCQYIAKDGFADDWHLVHLGTRAVGGTGLIFVEATAVTAQGRISPGDLGIWSDDHIEPLARIVRFVKHMNSKIAIQLAHAGRKASCDVPWNGGKPLTSEQGSWTVVAPSPIPFSEQHPVPTIASLEDIQQIIKAFIAATKRALKAGFDIIEIHAAHGYLIHEFLSPLSNHRRDQYGGDFVNRTRLLCEIVTQIRATIPSTMPLFVRISATDWSENGWDLNQSIELAKQLKKLGVDVIDVSSGGMIPHAKIPLSPGYQVPFASDIRKFAQIKTGAVGMITEAAQANAIITSGAADLVFLARELLKEPYWSLKAATAFNQTPEWPIPYGYAVTARK